MYFYNITIQYRCKNMYFSFIFIILRFIIGNRFIPRILSCLAEPDALRLCLAFSGQAAAL